ncbi:helix-turn-helix transcriptional regulator [Paracoccus pacificus]|uniref:Helix-turn-helix transcriptional regulator n=1 Tax=Paracoccus pacificus TaxID=1463598 RepID=A0ABW4RC63_9RHOB
MLSANKAAKAILADRTRLRLVDGHIAAANAHMTRALRGLVADACFRIDGEPGPGGELYIPPVAANANGLRVVVLPVDPVAECAACEPAAILKIEPVRISKTEARTAALIRRFGLSPREAQIAVHIADGTSVSELAPLLNVKICTVRTHLARILRKTGCNRQVQLVVLLNNVGVTR